MGVSYVRVGDVMQTSLHLIDGLVSVQEAVEAMQRHGVSTLVIERRHDGDEYGFVTVNEIAERVVAVNRSLTRTSVYEVMDKPTLTLNPAMNVKYAIRLLSQLGLRRALVAEENGLLGLVTLRDMVLSYARVEGAKSTSAED
ncbi:MAG: CBS domain-containing protein [Rhodobacteraceae bacterium]|nr:CBS domain-containing protein [Paracoccaceae bacterium]